MRHGNVEELVREKEELTDLELEYFKDKLFDLLNDSENMGIEDIDADERNNRFMVRMEDRNVFELCAGSLMEEYRQTVEEEHDNDKRMLLSIGITIKLAEMCELFYRG